jgi:hypothetical protein
MLIETVVRKLEADLSSLQFFVDEKKHAIVIPPVREGFGSIKIEDDGDELFVVVGNFTHWHAGCCSEELSNEEKIEAIAEDIVEFLDDLVNDKIILWGSHQGAGGFFYREHLQDWTSQARTDRKWLWSGPLCE